MTFRLWWAVMVREEVEFDHYFLTEEDVMFPSASSIAMNFGSEIHASLCSITDLGPLGVDPSTAQRAMWRA